MNVDNAASNTLREKFVSVLSPVICSGDENNILSLLSSLVNVCRPDSELLIPTSESFIEEAKTSEFTCWLIGELLTIECSQKVHEARVNILVNIFQLIATRNNKIFLPLMNDFIKIGQEGSDILFESGTKQLHIFDSVIDVEKANLKPKVLLLNDDKNLDSILLTIVEVLGLLNSYVMLYSYNLLVDVWRLFGLCLEAGSLKLKTSSLNSITKLIVICGLPKDIEVQDYILQLIGGCTVTIVKEDFTNEDREILNNFENSLLHVIKVLRENLQKINPIFVNEIGSSAQQFLQYHHQFENLNSPLLKELLNLSCDLINIQTLSLSADGIMVAMEDAVTSAIRMPQVIDTCLKFLICKEMDKVVVSDCSSSLHDSKKRNHQESERESVVFDCWAVSHWWNKVLNEINIILEEIENETSTEDSKVNCNLRILQEFLELITNVIACYSNNTYISISYISNDILHRMSNALFRLLSNTNAEDKIEKLLELFHLLMYITLSSRVSNNDEVRSLFQDWAGIGSLPWMATEMNLYDLKSKKENLLTISSKSTWSNASSLKVKCIPLLCLSSNFSAPNWRCFVVRAILNEKEEAVMSEIALWLPVLLHQLPNLQSQSILAESIGKLLQMESVSSVQLNLAKGLRQLFCVLSGGSEIRIRHGFVKSYECIYCNICEQSRNDTGNKFISSKQLDSALLQRIFLFYDNKEKDVILEFLESFYAISVHYSLSPNIFLPLMNLMVHSDEDVYESYVKRISHFIISERKRTTNNDRSERPIACSILKFLRDLVNCKEEEHSKQLRNQRNILQVLAHLTNVGDACFEEEIINFVIGFIADSEREISALGCLFIGDWCSTLRINPKELYLRNKKSIAETISLVGKEGEVAYLLTQISDVFNWSHGRENRGSSWMSFGTNQLKHLLPPFVLKACKMKKPVLLQELAVCFNLRLRDMLIDHFQHILAYLVFGCTDKEKENVFSVICSMINIDINNIRKCSVQNQVNELILGLHTCKEKVLIEFLEIQDIENDKKFSKESLNSDDAVKMKRIGDFLHPRFLGILGFLDGKLVSAQTMQGEKEEALLSLSELLAVMGKHHVSVVARKVLATLKTALKIKSSNITSINTKVWLSFLSWLDSSTLESVIEESVILCLPLIKAEPEKFASFFNKVLMTTPTIQPLFQYLPLLPHHQSLNPINEAIKKSQNLLERNSKEGLVETLESVRKSLTHESQDVRLFGLKKLKTVLLKNQSFIQQLILDSEKAHETVSEIFTFLLGQCRENEESDLLVAECLGLFGAIDPARLHKDGKKNKLSEVYEGIETESFVNDLVKELARSYLSASDAYSQTCASYAMQEILKLYKIGPTSARNSSSLGHLVYSKLPSNIQEILEPLQTSKYTISSVIQRSASNFPSPIYRSRYSKTFNHWVINWTCSLIEIVAGNIAKQVYASCKPLVRRDTTTALRILPPLIVCILTEDKSNHIPVSTEFLSVIGAEMPANVSDKFQPSDELQHLAVQTIFSCLDYVERWSRNRKQKETSYKKNKVIFTPSDPLQNVIDFLDQIPSDALALASFKSQAYSRALLHLETYCNKYPEKLKYNLRFLQSIYVELDEPDGVAGVAAIRLEEPCLKDQIIEYEATGRLHDALGCYERLCIAQETEETYDGMLKCYLNLGQPQSVLNITHGLISRKCDLGGRFYEYRAEAAWRLGQWNELESLLDSSEASKGLTWGEGVGKALLAARERNTDAYQKAMRDLRIQQIAPLSAASMEKSAYQRAYPSILRLQILNEMDEMLLGLLKVPLSVNVEDQHDMLVSNSALSDSMPTLSLSDLQERWNQRFSMLQMSYRFLEPLLNFRRTLLSLGRDWIKDIDQEESQNISEELERTWLKSAKVARKAGYLQQAELAFYGAGQGREVFVEKAKLHWAKGEQPQAVSVLTRGIEKFFPEVDLLKKNIDLMSHQSQKESCARAKLLLAHYSEESATLDVAVIKDYYRDVCEINKPWEDGHFHLAMYYDRILNSLDVKTKPVEWLNHIVQSFGKSLNYGCRYLYQSMPRLLSIWLDLGANVAEMETKKTNLSTITSYKEKLNVMNGFLIQILERLPLYMFLIALPQLISRICHSNSGVFDVLSKIIATLLVKYRQQSIWHLIAVSKSSYQTRLERCLQIFNIAKKTDRSLDKFIADATKLADLFIELSDKHVEKGVCSIKLDNFLRSLPRLLSEPKFSNIMMPIQSQMNVTLPTLSTNLKNLHSHNPFQRKEIYIKGIEDEVEIMTSLVRPKKITLIGSDGKKYIMMCKPKDDLRKDCRLMEFNSLINMLLMKDPETRKRDLKIRTYMVVPLNEECGIIEWISNLCALRHILHKLYKESGFYTSGQELKNMMCSLEDSLEKKRDVFLHRLIPKHPPIFPKWFLLTFVDPQAWVRARMSYCRTTAVMSMIGYIVGLGDRHGENILFDSESGDTVHVDLNCLFNKGEKFDWPERVPFRLTQNMVSAMGPTGVEGVFRKSCEVTMRVMHDKREELMSVLKPFIYDPLVEWEKPEKKNSGMKGAKVKGTGEIRNEKAQSLVKAIEERLSGQIKSDSRGVHLPLSVEGQVNVLIRDATNIDNLCQMYIGWAPFM